MPHSRMNSVERIGEIRVCMQKERIMSWIMAGSFLVALHIHWASLMKRSHKMCDRAM